jgi:hypothetical protein
MSDWYIVALTMPTYFNQIDRPDNSFSRWRITLIPPASFSLF